jgi:hypothetical protein
MAIQIALPHNNHLNQYVETELSIQEKNAMTITPNLLTDAIQAATYKAGFYVRWTKAKRPHSASTQDKFS